MWKKTLFQQNRKEIIGKKTRSTKYQLLIDKMVWKLQQLKNQFTIVWVDYKKLFDSLPQSWIIKSLEKIGISKNFRMFNRKNNETVKDRFDCWK